MQFLNLINNKNLPKKTDHGFTLIELLVVTIILGVLAAVSLPNLLGCVGSSRETEGKNSVGTMNRAQQAYHFEENTFSSNTKDLGIVVPNSEYYDYSQEITSNAAYAFAIPKDVENDGVRTYTGAIFFITDTEEYLQGICQSNEAGGEAFKPKLENGVVVCEESMILIQ